MNECESVLALSDPDLKKEEMATAAAVSNTSIGDGLTTRDGGEVEDFVQMSLAEFKQLTDLVKEQS